MMSVGGKNYSRRIIARGGNTGIWLSTIPNSVNGNILGAQEFIDAARRRYAMVPKNLPKFCDGCGAKFTLARAQSCKFGGPIHARHDAVKYELCTLLAMAICESAVRAEPLINPDSLISLRSNSNNENGTEDSEPDGTLGEILCNGFLGHRNKRTAEIVDVRVTDLDAPSHRNRVDEKVLESQEK